MSTLTEAAAKIQAEAETQEVRDALVNTQRQLKRANAKVEDLVEAVYHATRDAWAVERAMPPTPKPKRDPRKKGEEVALWHLTDWQGGKKTLSYGREAMRARVLQFAEKARHITEIQRADHPVRECHILFGGDMIEGVMIFPTQPFEIDGTLFEQKAYTSRLIADTVQLALGIYDRVTVTGEWGNHGRQAGKHAPVPASDNHDRECYEIARIILGNEPRLTWVDSAEDIQKVEIGNYRALLLHGDEVGRFGYVAQGTFLNYLNRLKAGGFGWAFRDAYSGHYHTHDERAMADGTGAWYQTGSTESDNRYARDKLGSSAHPSQRLHFIDPVRGRVTGQYKIWLD